MIKGTKINTQPRWLTDQPPLNQPIEILSYYFNPDAVNQKFNKNLLLVEQRQERRANQHHPSCRNNQTPVLVTPLSSG